jgi:predicted transcriptional regulator YdeE
MNPDLVTINEMKVVGLKIRTTNHDEMNPATGKIPGVWGRFSQEGLLEKIPDRKPGAAPMGVYSKYESDDTGPYSLLVGVETSGPDVPTGMSSVAIQQGQYLVFPGQGPMPQAVMQAWGAVWDYFSKESQYRRAYTTDFELYRGQDKVDIHIAIKNAK